MSLNLAEEARRFFGLDATAAYDRKQREKLEETSFLIQNVAELKQQLTSAGAKNENGSITVELTADDVKLGYLPFDLKEFLLDTPDTPDATNPPNFSLTVQADSLDETITFAKINLIARQEGQPTKGVGVELRTGKNLAETEIVYPSTTPETADFVKLRSSIKTAGETWITKFLIDFGNKVAAARTPRPEQTTDGLQSQTPALA